MQAELRAHGPRPLVREHETELELWVEKIREAFYAIHNVATGRSDRSYMSIPARPTHDADLILSAAIDELDALRKENERLRAQVENVELRGVRDEVLHARYAEGFAAGVEAAAKVIEGRYYGSRIDKAAAIDAIRQLKPPTEPGPGKEGGYGA